MLYGNPSGQILFVLSYPSRSPDASHFPLEGSIGVEATQCFMAAGIDPLDCSYIYAYPEYVNSNEEEDFFYRNKTAAKKGQAVEWPDGSFTIPQVYHHSLSVIETIASSSANIVIPVGDIATLAVCGNASSTKLRGSMLNVFGKKVIPTLDFRKILLQYHLRWQVITDLRRAVKHSTNNTPFVEPDWNFIVNPSYADVTACFDSLFQKADAGPLTLSVDLETANPLNSCIGIAWSTLDAICIPFFFEVTSQPDINYWSPEQELQIILSLRRLLTHPNVSCVGQNFLYDCQYMARNWGFKPNAKWDTMLMYHTCFSADSPKSLDFLASYFCEYYVYWKDESNHRSGGVDDITHWRYNCKDCVVTLEIVAPLLETVHNFKLIEQADFQMRMFHNALEPMLRGILWDRQMQVSESMRLASEIAAVEKMLNTIVRSEDYFPKTKKDYSPYYASPTKLATLLYEIFGLPLQRNKKTKRPSTDDDALTALIKSGDPIFRPWLELILKYRSLCTFKRTYLDCTISPDGRVRTSYNVGGTSTYRFSSSSDAFDDGLNLQNLSKGDAE